MGAATAPLRKLLLLDHSTLVYHKPIKIIECHRTCFMEIKKTQLPPSIEPITAPVEEFVPETVSTNPDSYTLDDLQNTLAQMKELQAKAQSGEIKIEDQHLLDDLSHHIDELSECLTELEKELTNE